jgi:hypothetical protein
MRWYDCEGRKKLECKNSGFFYKLRFNQHSASSKFQKSKQAFPPQIKKSMWN